MNSRATQMRKRSIQNKVYLPADNRENQYLRIELALSNDGMCNDIPTQLPDENELAKYYMDFKQAFFASCKLNGIKNAMFIANDKLVRVRFGDESQIIETNEQLIYFYDPKRHKGYKTFYDKSKLANKIVLMVLATGDDIRFNAATLHTKTCQMITDLAEQTGYNQQQFKIRDHQHITYDLFAAEKQDKQTTTHEFRSVPNRYKQQSLLLPNETKHNGYVIAKLPIPMHLIEASEYNALPNQPYKPLYNSIYKMVQHVVKQQNIKKFALVANGKQPVIGFNTNKQIEAVDGEQSNSEGELVYLSFSEEDSLQQFICSWNDTYLVDSIYLVFLPEKEDVAGGFFGKFVNSIQSVLRQIAKTLAVEPEAEHLMIRFHQNTEYQFPKGAER